MLSGPLQLATADPCPGPWDAVPQRRPRESEDETAMMHFSCDFCGKNLAAESSNRFIVKMKAYAAKDPAELTDEDLDDDQVEEMARMLNEQDDDDAPPLPRCQKMRFDLCGGCYREFLGKPLGRESVGKFPFTPH